MAKKQYLDLEGLKRYHQKMDDKKVDNSRLVVLSKSEFDALGKKDSRVFYFVTEDLSITLDLPAGAVMVGEAPGSEGSDSNESGASRKPE